MTGKNGAIVKLAALGLAWVVVAVAAAILFGDAVNAHTNTGLAAALVVAVVGLAGLGLLSALSSALQFIGDLRSK